MPIIGIDLGTTNSLVSCVIDNECVIIPNALNESKTPSVVSVLDNDEIIVGSAAKERLITHPQHTAAAFKRYMGTNKKYTLGKYTFTPTELSSFVLRSLKADAEAFLGTQITEAVISVPAYFNDQQRRATKQAGELAGLKVERLINEPTAAAVSYGLHQSGDEKQFLVFDLGGGTFDVSILDFFDNIFEVKAVAGNNFLGGEDFDQCLIDYFLKRNNIDKYDLDLKAMSILKKLAEKCKISLSNSDSYSLNYTINGQDYDLAISNSEFEAISKDLLIKLKQPLLKAFRDSNMYTHDLDEIILVGGSTKMPLIRSFAAKYFGRLPLCSLNPDEIVALGAGIYAAMKERNEFFKETVLTDVCPYTLGVEVVTFNEFGEIEDGHFLPIIERNTTVPFSKVKRLYNVFDYQRAINVSVYQGESRLVENNIKLGELELYVPPAPRGKSAVDVRYTYDINGILEVEVTSVATGEKKRKVILRNDCTLTDEEVEARLKELEEIKIHPRENAKSKYLLAKAERLYEETLSDLRLMIAKAIQHFESVLERQNPEEVKSESLKFEAFLNKIEDWEN
ncbi:Hsp70 family protein [Acetivibrio mesophilus]|uniref:Chaperone protein DnaK n=1 Tax=Acetivibrio mesophilus TaxID=2487273 RepID=A0A4Q0I3U6_9FIRM|nr:molecular chaperone HscC [Acetivibrio mesophilus]RXE58437.1 molecular chaperone HscC [Acetivibrio mesophilus]